MLFFGRQPLISSCKSYIIIIGGILGLSSCTIEKQYHSWGWKISTSSSISGKTRSLESSLTNKTTERSNNANTKINSNAVETFVAPFNNNNTQHQETNSFFKEISPTSLAQKFDKEKFIDFINPYTINWLTKPQDTVFFPEKYHHRKHGTLYLPQIKNEEEFNTATAFANLKDVSAWNWFDRGHISAKIALYWLFGFMAMIIIIGLGNISLAGVAASTRKTITSALILVPAVLFAIGYICYLMGTFSIWKANKLYKNALFKLPYDLKLKADAIIMHARIPYVSKGATLRHAKRILNTYPNDRNGEWLEDVSKTKREIETGRTSLTINNWSRMRTVGFITTLFIVAFLAIKFL